MTIKELRGQIDDQQKLIDSLITKRRECSQFSYTLLEKEKNIITKPEHDFEELTNQLDNENNTMRWLKEKLRKANESHCKNGISIADNLFRLKQVDSEIGSLSRFENKQKLRRSSGYNGEIEFTELAYDLVWLDTRLGVLRSERKCLQDMIDLANLTIEI